MPVALQSDGKIIAAGQTGSGFSCGSFALARYDTGGTLDPGFGGTGNVVTNFGVCDGTSIQAVGIQADGKIVAAGGGNGGFGLARYNTDGSLDSSFGSGGTVTIGFGVSFGQANALTLMGSGEILTAGLSINPSSFASMRWVLTRLTATGALDPTFGTGGEVTTSFETAAGARGLAIDSTGKIIAGGTTYTQVGSTFPSDFALASYKSSKKALKAPKKP
jgi:uncharacterized delta-60 repeat protein